LGYFCLDADTSAAQPIFNRTLTLRDTWARLQAKGKANS
jgi:glutaminyl-tRNA synthetase